MSRHARSFVLAGLSVLLIPLGVPPVLAQDEHATAEERLAAIDQEEAIAVMRAAILHAEAELAVNGQPSGRRDSTLDRWTKLTASGLPSTSSSPASTQTLAERLADALVTELVQQEGPGVYMTSQLPKIDGSKASVRVSRTEVFPKSFSTHSWDLELERSPGKSWQVFEVSRSLIACGVTGAASSSFEAVKEKPELIGGDKALYEALRYPNLNVEGIVYIQFVVNPDGQARDFEILRSPHEQFSKEAERVLRKMRFTPGRDAQGEAVAARTSLAIRFEQ